MITDAANDVVDEFAEAFEEVLKARGAHLVRLQIGHSDRSFLIVRGEKVLRFVAKLSQSANSFWGLGVARSAAMLQEPGEFLLLLTSLATGYALSPIRLSKLLPKLGTDRAGRDYKIQHGKVRRELPFRSLDELADQLLPRLNDVTSSGPLQQDV